MTLLSRLISSKEPCDHNWHNPVITGKKDHFGPGRHKVILKETCKLCDATKEELWHNLNA